MCPKEDIFSYLLNEGCLHCKQPDGLNKGSPGRGLPWGAWGLSLPAVTAVSCQDLSRLSSSFLAFSLPHWQFSWEFCCFSRMRGILFFKLFQSNIWNFSGVLFIDPYLPVLAQQLTQRFCGRFGDVGALWSLCSVWTRTRTLRAQGNLGSPCQTPANLLTRSFLVESMMLNASHCCRVFFFFI